MRIVIEIKESRSSIPGYWDLQIDGTGWDRGLDSNQIETAVGQHIRSTVELLAPAHGQPE